MPRSIRCDRLVHLPGEQVQCDLWFPGALVPDHGGVLQSFPVLVMVAGYSRFIAAMMIPSRVTGDLLAGMWRLLQDLARFLEHCCGTTSPVSAVAAGWPTVWPDSAVCWPLGWFRPDPMILNPKGS